jgi:mannan endo-1,4-beta-mannosidase
MRAAQTGLAHFLPLIDWSRLRRRNLNAELRSSRPELALFGCGDEEQAIAWLLRTDSLGPDGALRHDAEPLAAALAIPGLRPGGYRVTLWDTCRGVATRTTTVQHDGGDLLCIPAVSVATDLAVAVQRCGA